SWVGSGGERRALARTHHLHVAAGEAGATVWNARSTDGLGVRSPRLRNPASSSPVSFAAPAMLAAARRSHRPPDHACSPFLSDPRRSLGSVSQLPPPSLPATSP